MDRHNTLGSGMDRRELLRRGALAGLGLSLGPMLAPGAALAASRPAPLPHLTQLIASRVGPGKFPGMVSAVGLPGREAQYIARGSEGFTDPDTITPDSLFRIYSMTKPITGMAAMMLIDEGKLGLDQPLADILPKYAHMQVQKVPDGSLTELRPAKNPILIRNLLTHTAGLGYTIIQKGPIKQAMEEAGVVAGQVSRIPLFGLDRGKPVESLEAFADRLADIPLVYEPGTKWSYSLGLDLLGRVIEVVSGMPLDRFLDDRIFGPAGMTSTFFQVPRSEAGRLTTNYAAQGELLIPIDKGESSIYLDKPPFPFGGSGLVSSPRDYDRFLHMLANYGTLNGTRVMSELAVRVGTSNLLPDGVEGKMPFGPPSGFGAGGRVGIGDEAGIFGWAGAAGTVGMVDMKHGIRSSIFVQFMPPDANSLLYDYQEALKADLTGLTENLHE